MITSLPSITGGDKKTVLNYEVICGNRESCKIWVVLKAHVNNPYGKYWSAAVAIGYDYYGKGDTIEKAYNDMVQQILKSPSIMAKLKNYESFVEIVKSR